MRRLHHLIACNNGLERLGEYGCPFLTDSNRHTWSVLALVNVVCGPD
jgi:hypothetical protein